MPDLVRICQVPTVPGYEIVHPVVAGECKMQSVPDRRSRHEPPKDIDSGNLCHFRNDFQERKAAHESQTGGLSGIVARLQFIDHNLRNEALVCRSFGIPPLARACDLADQLGTSIAIIGRHTRLDINRWPHTSIVWVMRFQTNPRSPQDWGGACPPSGSRMVTIRPPSESSALAAAMVPPWARTARSVMARPRPTPPVARSRPDSTR